MAWQAPQALQEKDFGINVISGRHRVMVASFLSVGLGEPHKGKVEVRFTNDEFGDLEKLRGPHKLVFVGESPRALASRIFEPVKRATFQIASGGAAQRRNHSN